MCPCSILGERACFLKQKLARNVLAGPRVTGTASEGLRGAGRREYVLGEPGYAGQGGHPKAALLK